MKRICCELDIKIVTMMMILTILLLLTKVEMTTAWTYSAPAKKILIQRGYTRVIRTVSVRSPLPPVPVTQRLLLHSTSDDTATTTTTGGGGGGGLVRQGAGDVMKQQLLNAFTNLGTADQYDAVLTGLCAKILDDTKLETTMAIVAIQDCTDLLEEMNTSKIMASSRSLMALLDATTKTQSATCMARVIRLCIRNSFFGGTKQQSNGIQQYGQQQRDIRILPMPRGSNYNNNQKILCPDGTKKTVQERLSSYEDVPTDDERSKEVTSAGIFGATAVTSEIINLSSPSDSMEHFITSSILTLMILVTIIDNGYDFINMASQFALSQMKVDNKDKFQLPDKTALPLNLGQGIITGSVIRGFTRLLTIDPVRESQCEAAALYTAYVLGLPCFPYRPNAFEASVLVAESVTKDTESSKGNNDGDDSTIDNLLTSSGVLRILMWLYAPIVIEYMNHPQLVMSDPREATGFLKRIEEYYGLNDSRLFWLDDDNTNNVNDGMGKKSNKDNLLKWAYMEADVLIRNNKQIVLELSDRLASGAATIGDCVAVIEGWE